MSKKLIQLALSAWLFALSFPAAAQQPAKIPRIGFLVGTTGSAASTRTEGFRQGLRDLGYVEGKNILIEYRYAEGKLERIPGLVTELLQLKIDLLVVANLVSIQAAKQATDTTPIVMLITADPVELGIVADLARPGGNITGIATLIRELSGKRLELLMEVIPGMSRVEVLWDVNGSSSAIGYKAYESTARALKTPLQALKLHGPNPDLDGAFRDAVKGGVRGLITIRTPLLNRYAKQIADHAMKNRLPSMSEGSDYVEAGGLMSYSANDADSYRRAAVYVDRILKGTKPADLPVEQPRKFELVINLKTANQIRVTIPPSVLLRADKVIR